MIQYISKGRIEALKCPRKYFYSYRYGKGYDSKKPSLPLAIGIATHRGLEALLKKEEIFSACDEGWAEATKGWPTNDPFLRAKMEEGLALSKALTYGWSITRLEKFLATYDIISIEEEVEMPLSSNVMLIARCDVVVRDKLSGTVYVVNWKTTSDKKDWTTQWGYDIQMWTEAMAIEQKLGLLTGGCVVEGLYKGTVHNGLLSTPLLYGHKKEDEVCVGWKKGWDKFPAYKDIGIKEWIDLLPLEVVEQQFLTSEPILKNDDVVEDWLRQIVARESAIQTIMDNGTPQDHLDYFSQQFSRWNCRGCPFWDVCMKRTSIEEMVKEGLLVVRESPLTRRTNVETSRG
jgi:CRISPR/Cas system-associated exonuclease Cas4 (RecB family)